MRRSRSDELIHCRDSLMTMRLFAKLLCLIDAGCCDADDGRVAVSGLSMYPTHQVHRYRRVPGVCRRPTETQSVSIDSAHDVSWTTCRYLCDKERQRPCIGFTYRPSPRHYSLNSHHVNSTSQPRCLLIATVCQLVKSHLRNRAATYIKGPLFTGS